MNRKLSNDSWRFEVESIDFFEEIVYYICIQTENIYARYSQKIPDVRSIWDFYVLFLNQIVLKLSK